MQPTYLPWQGYFNLIWNSDVFIFLDNVQYTKNSFCSRNRYPANNDQGFTWLTVPVRQASLAQTFRETHFVNDTNWRKKHLTTLQQNYGKLSSFNLFYPILESILKNEEYTNLADFNAALIMNISHYLGMKREFHLASNLNIVGERCDRLLSFCRKFKCDTYLSPAGAKDYIEEDKVLLESEIKVIFQDFKCREYPQRGISKFTPYMSVIDLIFNTSKEEALS